AVISVWITIENPFPDVLFYFAMVAGFAVLGIAPLALRRAGLDAPWQRYLFPMLDMALLTITVIVPNPLSQRPALPPPLRLRLGNELYYFVFLTASMLTYSPGVVLWTGVCAAAGWSVATMWVVMLPDTFAILRRSQWATLTHEQTVATMLNPHFVHLGIWGRQVVLLLVVAGSLAAIVWRVRRLVLRQIEVERQRTNLSRYFSPNMVEELAGSDEPLRTTRTQSVAVLFVDIVGFTSLSENQSPEAVIQLLRQFHGLIARTVFEHDGTLDKYLGDGALVTFGTPRVGSHDAGNALACARAILLAVGSWNEARARRAEAPIRIGIGVHYGPAVLGDIGDEHRLEFAVIGDTVNVASRLQDLTRIVGANAIVSQDLVDAVRAGGASAELAGLIEIAPQTIRGRDGTLRVWTLSAPGAADTASHRSRTPST
ncbi:MAG TPA: adenylate/guanylate cyclase domain-containing protein, partial [Candidatus Kryptonia bacterium]|nr:adenylate/guanylate cyclase domain-containing protein [Candidatus Kryptonia bacterium]